MKNMPRQTSTTGHAAALSVELHGAPADGQVRRRPELVDYRRGTRLRTENSTFRGGLVHMRENHRRRLDQFVDHVGGRHVDAGVVTQVEYGEVRPVKFVDDRSHLRVDTGIARKPGGQSVGELHDIACGRTVLENRAVGLKGGPLRFGE